MKNRSFIATCILAVVGFVISLWMIIQLDTFFWDEAHHAFFSNLIYNDLRSFNLGKLVSDTNAQAWFQPLHSYLNAFFFLLMGKSYLSARLSSAFMYVILFFIIDRYSKVLSKENGWKISIAANLLLVSSPYMWIMSSVNMQEMMGAVIILAALLFYVTRCVSFSYRDYLIMGLIMSVALLAKYHYGILLGAAIFLIELSRVFDVKDKAIALKDWVIRNVTMLVGFLPLTALWFLSPPVERKIGLFLYRFQDVEGGYKGFNAFDRFLFYIKSIVSSYSFSLLIGIFMVIAVLYCIRSFRDIRIRALLLLVFSFLAFHSTISLVFERLICPMMPAVFILSGAVAVDIYNRLPGSNLKRAVITIIIVLIAGDMFSCLPYASDLAARQNTRQLNSRTFFGLVARPSYLFAWEPGMDTSAVFVKKPITKMRDVLDFCSSTIPKDSSISTLVSFLSVSPYQLYWTFSDRKANVFTVNDYPAVGKYFWFSEYYIELEIKKDSPYIAEVKDGGKSWSDAALPLKQRGWMKLYASKDFDDIGVVAKIYKMKLPF